jgi:hypothetical protein
LAAKSDSLPGCHLICPAGFLIGRISNHWLPGAAGNSVWRATVIFSRTFGLTS